MVSFRTFALAAIALAGSVSAAPTSDLAVRDVASANALSARDSPTLFVTVDANWQGENANFPFTIGAGTNVYGPCLNLQFDFDNSITSAGPPQLYYCQLFIDPNCGGGSLVVGYPGTPQLPDAFNDKISSFRCAHVNNVG